MHCWPMRFGGEERSPLLVSAPAHMAEGVMPPTLRYERNSKSSLKAYSWVIPSHDAIQREPQPLSLCPCLDLQTLRSSVLGTSTGRWSGHHVPVRVYARGVVLSARQREWKGDAYCICR